MPTYDYECESCGSQFEAFHGLNDPAPQCPACGHAVCRRLITAVAFRTGGDGTADRVAGEIKKRLGQGRAGDALRLADKAVKIAGERKGMGKIKAARDKLAGHLKKD